jgi:hypothetical protein
LFWSIVLPSRLYGGKVLQLGTRDEELSDVWFIETGEHAQRRGLVAPGRTEEIAGVHRHADVVDGDDLTVGSPQEARRIHHAGIVVNREVHHSTGISKSITCRIQAHHR